MGWFGRYFLSLLVENTTLYLDKHPRPQENSPESATIGLLEPLDSFTWILDGQWERVLGTLKLPLASLGFEEEDEEDFARETVPKPLSKPRPKPLRKPLPKPNPKAVKKPVVSPVESAPDEDSDENASTNSSIIFIEKRHTGNSTKDAQQTSASSAHNLSDLDEEMADPQEEHQSECNTNASVSAYLPYTTYF